MAGVFLAKVMQIWQNVSENGPFFATTFSRPFKDQAGAWRNGTSFGLTTSRRS
nr:hypothetical protein [Nitrosomonas nitrosa]